MADKTERGTPPANPAGAAIDAGNYELIRGRLETLGRELGDRVEALNGRRQEIFGSTALAIIGNERVRTEHNCVPRDMVAIGDQLLFGYNVFMGLRTQVSIGDVFSVHHFKEGAEGYDLSPVASEETRALFDPTFVRDFEELYRYYKETRLVHLRKSETRMLAVFQTTESARDYKVFRWELLPDGQVRYIDNRGEREYTFPPSHDFEWTLATRESHVQGRFPHVSILDEVFVETTGGDLTIKVENNTERGEGIYAEPVEDRYQSLDDAEIAYAKVGVLILLRIKPYREEARRYLVYNTRTRSVERLDAIGQACIQLPNDHGVIFPGGYYLNTGELKTFDTDVTGMQFKSVLRAPNGEDVLYVFYQPVEGRKILLPYNLIRKEVQNPIPCHGFSLFRDGRMIAFRYDSSEPTRVHPVQIWQTPYCSSEYAASVPRSPSFLAKVGNPELVRGISDANTVRRMIENQSPSLQAYEDLIAGVNRALDTYHWLGHAEVGLQETFRTILSTAEKIIDEFEKVITIRNRTKEALEKASKDQAELRSKSRPDSWVTAAPFVDILGRWRRQQGALFTLRELRYIDLGELEKLEAEAREQFKRISDATVKFLLDDKALEPYKQDIAQLHSQVDAMPRAIDLVPLRAQVDKLGGDFDLLTEIISGLKIDDATIRTQILERISEVYALLNRTKAHLERSYKDMGRKEGVAQFGVEFKLFAQSVSNGLAMTDSPEKCDEQLSRLSVLLEELEARFGEFDEFMSELAGKREEVFEAFESRKRSLLDERNRRSQNLVKAADRILAGVVRRAQAFTSLEDLNTFFVADPMIAKVRDIAEQLKGLGDSTRADELFSRLKSARQEASRTQRDKAELFDEGDAVIKLGRHRFSVSTQPVELTLMPRDGVMTLHLTGTDFFEPLVESELDPYRPYWDQQLISENDQVYRGEYLAVSIFDDAEKLRNGQSLERLHGTLEAPDGLLGLVREVAAQRYDEGYERGVHDADAARILERLLDMHTTSGLLRYAADPRGWAALFWAFFPDAELKSRWQVRARSFSRLAKAFEGSPILGEFAGELAGSLRTFLAAQGLAVPEADALQAGAYLRDELAQPQVRFVLSGTAVQLRDALLLALDRVGVRDAFLEDLRSLEGRVRERLELARAWAEAFLERLEPELRQALQPVALETAVAFLTEGRLDREISSAMNRVEIPGLLGSHPRIRDRKLELRLDELLTRVGEYRRTVAPAFQRFRALRHEVIEREQARLRLKEFQPRILSSFVRNKLINDVYLPLIGDNLAKQMGALGEGKRTDLMGMLLLISPPGYGKTTLMEYVANRLGLIFMKINGPALGHEVTSIDPSEAPNATSRQEIEKLNLALEMGNNVMLYLDDIQHTNPELLQKFISLCDAQRKIEGVWRGRTRTYDLRGKRFCVVMAGNPYTESGEKFQIPDMLANRADTYNLGDILNGREDAFALSYLENALTSNPVISPLAARDPKDIYLLLRLARGEEIERSQLSHDYTQAELDDIISLFRKLFLVQEVLLKVNLQYIASASQADDYRTEPPFKLQGSYRNMNKIAEKVVSVMNDAELQALIDDHYVGEAQTLTVGAEQNLLKLAELRARMTDVQLERWKEIKKTFGQRQMLGGGEADPVTRLIAPLAALVQEVRDVRSSIDDPVRHTLVARVQDLVSQLAQAREGLSLEMQQSLGKQLEALGTRLEASSDALQTSLAEQVGQPIDQLTAQLTGQLTAGRESLQGTLVGPVGSGLERIGNQLAQSREGMTAALQAEVSAPLATLAQSVDRSSAELSAGVRGALHAGLQESLSPAVTSIEAAVQQLRTGVRTSLEKVMTPQLEALLGQVQVLNTQHERRQEALLEGLTQQVGAPLGGVLEQLATLTPPLTRLEHAVGRLESPEVTAALEALVVQLTQVGLHLERGTDPRLLERIEQVGTELETVGATLAAGTPALGARVEAIVRGLEQLCAVTEAGAKGDGAALEAQTAVLRVLQAQQAQQAQQALRGQLQPAPQLAPPPTQTQAEPDPRIPALLEVIATRLEQSPQVLRGTLERSLVPTLVGLSQQVAGVREELQRSAASPSSEVPTVQRPSARALEAREQAAPVLPEGGASDPRVMEAVLGLRSEIKELREAGQALLYRPLVALTQQLDAIRRGLQESLGVGLTSRLDVLAGRLEALDKTLQESDANHLHDEITAISVELRYLRASYEQRR